METGIALMLTHVPATTRHYAISYPERAYPALANTHQHHQQPNAQQTLSAHTTFAPTHAQGQELTLIIIAAVQEPAFMTQ